MEKREHLALLPHTPRVGGLIPTCVYVCGGVHIPPVYNVCVSMYVSCDGLASCLGPVPLT